MIGVMPSLGVNIDHVATLRQARYRETPESPNAEPDPVAAALVAEKAGAVGSLWDVVRDRRLPHRPEVVSGVLEAECAAILSEFFKAQR